MSYKQCTFCVHANTNAIGINQQTLTGKRFSANRDLPKVKKINAFPAYVLLCGCFVSVIGRYMGECLTCRRRRRNLGEYVCR